MSMTRLLLLLSLAQISYSAGAYNQSNLANVNDFKERLFADLSHTVAFTQTGKAESGKVCTLFVRPSRYGVQVGLAEQVGVAVNFRVSVSSLVSREYTVLESDQNLLEVQQTEYTMDERGDMAERQYIKMLTLSRPGAPLNVVEVTVRTQYTEKGTYDANNRFVGDFTQAPEETLTCRFH